MRVHRQATKLNTSIISNQFVCLQLSLWFAEQRDLEQSQFLFNLSVSSSLRSSYHLPKFL